MLIALRIHPEKPLDLSEDEPSVCDAPKMECHIENKSAMRESITKYLSYSSGPEA